MRYFITLCLLAACLQAAPWSPATVDGFTPSLIREIVEYWELNESVNGSTATGRVNSIVLTDVNTYIKTTGGKLAGGLTNYNAKTCRLETTDTNLNHTNFTLSIWINQYAFYDFAFFAARRIINNNPNQTWQLSSGASSLNFAVFTNGSAGFVSVSASVNSSFTNNWIHCICVKSNSLIYFYTNSVLVGSAQLLGYNQSAAKFTIGQASDGVFNYANKGNIDEVGFWNRGLTQSEITQLYNATKARRFPFNSGP